MSDSCVWTRSGRVERVWAMAFGLLWIVGFAGGCKHDAEGSRTDSRSRAASGSLTVPVAVGLDRQEPAEEAPREAAATTQAEEPVADEDVQGPRTVLILGDSLAATGFGAMLEHKLEAYSEIACARKGKSASGLARPDFFDWIAEGQRQVRAHEPDLVVVILGGNDGQDLIALEGDQTPVRWRSEAWASAYRKRVDTFLAEISGPDRAVLWLGLPTMGLRSFEKKLKTIRSIQREAVEALAGEATYLDTAPFVTQPSGALLETVSVGNGKRPQKIRAEDRIHFTMPGSRYFADAVFPEVIDALGLQLEALASPDR